MIAISSEDMEDMIFGSDPDPHDPDNCLDNANERQQRYLAAWLLFLEDQPPLPELMMLLGRIHEEWREERSHGIPEHPYLILLGSGYTYVVECTQTQIADIEWLFSCLAHHDDEFSQPLRERACQRLDRLAPQYNLF